MSTIKVKRSSVQGLLPDLENNELELGEIAINTHDGKMYFKKDEFGDVSLHEVAKSSEAENVFYVSKSGNDDNDGKTLSTAFLTIDQALMRATPASVTFDLSQGNTIISNDTIALPGNIFDTGDEVVYNQGENGAYSSLLDGQKYYVRKTATGIVSLHASKAFAISNTSPITLAAYGAGTSHSLTRETEGTTIFVKSGTYIIGNVGGRGQFASGEYDMGGLVVPPNVSIVGDNLRTTKIKGSDQYHDLFYVQNASYITNVTFIGMKTGTARGEPRAPAAVSFPPLQLQPGNVPQLIQTSPYVENCTAFNTTATGMLIDGSLTAGLRSMVSDSFTQINAGGTGVHIINRGYAQLVSIFTVSCEHAVLCESGGQCSLTNSNASFGTFGLKSTGSSEDLYAGATNAQSQTFGEYFEIATSTPPKYGDAFSVAETGGLGGHNVSDESLEHYSVEKVVSSIDFTGTTYAGNTLATFDPTSNGVSTAAKTITIPNHGFQQDQPVKYFIPVDSDGNVEYSGISGLTANTVYFVNLAGVSDNTNKFQLVTTVGEAPEPVQPIANNGSHYIVPKFFYNTTKCSRDAGYIIDAIADDNALGTNFNSVYTGLAYQRGSVYTGGFGTTYQKNPTLAMMYEISRRIKPLHSDNGLWKQAVTNNIGIISNTLINGSQSTSQPGDGTVPALTFPTALARPQKYIDAKNALQTNRQTIIDNVIADIDAAVTSAGIGTLWYNFSYGPNGAADKDRCKRDIGFIVDAMTYDVLYNTNTATIRAASSYRVDGNLQLGSNGEQTEEAYNNFLKTRILAQLASSDITTSFTNTQISGDSDIAITGHLYNTGDSIVYTVTSGSNITGLVDGGKYYIIRIDDNTINFASSHYNALNGIALSVSDPAVSSGYQIVGGLREQISRSIGEIVSFIDAGGHALPQLAGLKFTNDAGAHPSPGSAMEGLQITARNAILTAKSSIQTSVSSNIDVYRVAPLEDIRIDYTGSLETRFKKRSLIAASSMTFEYVGTGTEIRGLTDSGANTDDLYNRPRTDDFPKTENEVIQDSTTNLGAVYFTSTDHKGDFRIGSELHINRTDGRIEGDAFNRSLFSVMTPYILAIEGN